MRAERLALKERHRVVGDTAHVAGGEHRHDVGLLQRRGEPDLTAEALDAHGARGLARQHFTSFPRIADRPPSA